jgi:predicted Zn-dependent peptidase
MNYFAPIIANIFPYGSLMDKKGLEGNLSATIDSLKFANKKYRNSRDLLMAIESTGSEYDSLVAKEYSFNYLRSPEIKLESARSLLDDLLNSAKVTDESVTKVQENAKNALEELKIDLYSYAQSQFVEKLAGIGLTIGNEKSIQNISKKTISENIEKLQNNNVRLEVFSKEDYKISGDLEKLRDTKKEFVPSRKEDVVVFEEKDIPQAFLMYGFLTSGYEDFDPAVVAVCDSIIGSSECGLTFNRIREEKSAAYFATGNHSLSRSYGLNYIVAGIDVKNLDTVVNEIVKIRHELTTEQLDSKIFETSKNIEIGQLISISDSPASTATYYIQQLTSSYSLDKIVTIEQMCDRISRVKKEDVFNYYEKVFLNNSPMLYVLGNVKKEDASKYKRRLLDE